MKSLVALVLLTSAPPALAQSMDHSMHQPAPQPTPKPDVSAQPAGLDHSMPGMDMSVPADPAQAQAGQMLQASHSL